MSIRHRLVRGVERLLQAEAAPSARMALVLGAALLTLVVATLRVSLEAHLGISLVLLVPIMLVAWYVNAPWALGMVALVVLTWHVADRVELTASVPMWVVNVNSAVRASVFALVVVLTAALRAAYRRQHLLATRDALTGLLNRRQFMATAEAERLRARRYRHPITLGFLDLDNFKAINDRYGHETGDQVLRLVGVYLLRRLRSVDISARLGGDEFVVLLPQTGPQPGAATIAEVQSGVVRELRAQGFDVGLSAGVATFLEAPDSVDEMLDTADRLMYEAKRADKGALRQTVVPSASKGAREAQPGGAPLR
jgi:diguanylate cyclase (GGDEF)-like protein